MDYGNEQVLEININNLFNKETENWFRVMCHVIVAIIGSEPRSTLAGHDHWRRSLMSISNLIC